MENRHLFRGMRLQSGTWIVGYYAPAFRLIGTPIAMIMSYDGKSDVEINPATLGQCTGLPAAKSYRGERDEDRLVFEGDRVQDGDRTYTVEWDSEWGVMILTSRYPGGSEHVLIHYVTRMEIIDTIYDQEAT